jgi:hypothetical protein
VSHVEFRYVDRIGLPTRAFSVFDLNPKTESRSSIADEIHAANFLQQPTRRTPQGPSLGPTTSVEPLELEVAGAVRSAKRWRWLEHPHLVMLRFSLPGTWIRLFGWELREPDLLALAGRLSRLETDTDLFRQMQQAQRVSDTA